jgi:type I restriction enzyme, S subunit
VLNQHIFKVIPRGGVSKIFLFYALKHYSSIWADVDAHGSTMRHIKRESLSNKIYVPDLATQNEIADFLDRETAHIDQLIEKREAFLSLIDERKATLAVTAVDGSILEGVAKGIEGWFGALPESWQVKRAKFLFRERQDRSEAGEEELLTVSHITGVTKRSDKDVNMFLAESMEGYKLVSEGDVVINTMWAWMGAMGVSPIEGLISPSYGVYAPRGDAFEADYLDLLLRSRPFVAEATRRSKGIHSSRLRLYPDAFLDILLPVPSREAQRAILTALMAATEMEEKLANLSRLSLDRLREFRAALITAAVTGQIDVTTWGKRGTTDRRLDAMETDMAAAAQPERQQVRA